MNVLPFKENVKTNKKPLSKIMCLPSGGTRSTTKTQAPGVPDQLVLLPPVGTVSPPDLLTLWVGDAFGSTVI